MYNVFLCCTFHGQLSLDLSSNYEAVQLPDTPEVTEQSNVIWLWLRFESGFSSRLSEVVEYAMLSQFWKSLSSICNCQIQFDFCFWPHSWARGGNNSLLAFSSACFSYSLERYFSKCMIHNEFLWCCFCYHEHAIPCISFLLFSKILQRKGFEITKPVQS